MTPSASLLLWLRQAGVLLLLIGIVVFGQRFYPNAVVAVGKVRISRVIKSIPIPDVEPKAKPLRRDYIWFRALSNGSKLFCYQWPPKLNRYRYGDGTLRIDYGLGRLAEVLNVGWKIHERTVGDGDPRFVYPMVCGRQTDVLQIDNKQGLTPYLKSWDWLVRKFSHDGDDLGALSYSQGLVRNLPLALGGPIKQEREKGNEPIEQNLSWLEVLWVGHEGAKPRKKRPYLGFAILIAALCCAMIATLFWVGGYPLLAVSLARALFLAERGRQ